MIGQIISYAHCIKILLPKKEGWRVYTNPTVNKEQSVKKEVNKSLLISNPTAKNGIGEALLYQNLTVNQVYRIESHV